MVSVVQKFGCLFVTAFRNTGGFFAGPFILPSILPSQRYDTRQNGKIIDQIIIAPSNTRTTEP